jgi:hypothetical protein
MTSLLTKLPVLGPQEKEAVLLRVEQPKYALLSASVYPLVPSPQRSSIAT